MPHDGCDRNPPSDTVLLPGLTDLTGAATAQADTVLSSAVARLRAAVVSDGRIDPAALDDAQTAAHGLAWLATYVEALRQLQGWTERLQAEGRFGEIEQLLHQIAFGEYLA